MSPAAITGTTIAARARRGGVRHRTRHVARLAHGHARRRAVELASITVEELEGLVELDSLPIAERNVLRGGLPSARKLDAIRAEESPLIEEALAATSLEIAG